MKKTTILLLALTVLLSGCERQIESRDPLRSVPDPLAVPTNLQVTVNEETLQLEWTVTDDSNIDRYRIYVADTLPENFRVHDSVTNTSAELTGLIINRRYYLQVAPVSREGIEGDRSQVIAATIAYVSITINLTDTHTRTQEVTVQISSSAPATHVMLSEDPTFADAEFMAWAPERPFLLSPGDGLKTVYGKLVFTSGVESGEMLQDVIILDTRASIDSVFYQPSNTTFAVGETIRFGLDAGEPGGQAQVSFAGVPNLVLVDDGTSGDIAAEDGIYHGQYTVPVSTNIFEAVVTGAFVDAAGNPATPTIGNDLLNINTPPSPVDVNLIPGVDSTRFQWNESSEPDFDSYRIYCSTSLPVDTTDELLAIIPIRVPPAPWYGLETAAVLTYYRVFVFDQHGAAAGSNTVF